MNSAAPNNSSNSAPSTPLYDFSTCQFMFFSPSLNGIILFLAQYHGDTTVTCQTQFVLVKRRRGVIGQLGSALSGSVNGALMAPRRSNLSMSSTAIMNTSNSGDTLSSALTDLRPMSQILCPSQKEQILQYEWMPENGALIMFVPYLNRVLIHGGQMNHRNALEWQFKYMNEYTINPFLFVLQFEKDSSSKDLSQKKRKHSKKKSRKRSKSATMSRRTSQNHNSEQDVNHSQAIQTNLPPTPRYSVTWNIQPTALGEAEPILRFHHAGCIWKEKYLLIHGGQSTTMKNLNDLWCLDLENWTWKELKTTGDSIPPPRRLHTMEIVDDRHLYVFGGLPLNNELYRLDLETLEWIDIDFSIAPALRVMQQQQEEARRQSQVSSLMEEGISPNDATMRQEIHSTDDFTPGGEVSRQTAMGKFDLLASPRFGHSMKLIGNSLVLFGGQDMNNYFTETIQIPLRNIEQFLRNLNAFRIYEESKRPHPQHDLLRVDTSRKQGDGEWSPGSDNDAARRSRNMSTPGASTFSPADFSGFNNDADLNDLLLGSNGDEMDEIASYQKRKQKEEEGDDLLSDDSAGDEEIEALIFNDKVSKRFASLKKSLKKKNEQIKKQKQMLEAKDKTIREQQEEMEKLKQQVQNLQLSNRGLENYILSKGEEIPHGLLAFLPSQGPLAENLRNQNRSEGEQGTSGHEIQNSTGMDAQKNQRGRAGPFGGRVHVYNQDTKQLTAPDGNTPYPPSNHTLIDRSLEKENIDNVVRKNMEKAPRKEEMSESYISPLTENRIISMNEDDLQKVVRTKQYTIKHMRERLRHQEQDLIINDTMMRDLKETNEKLKRRVAGMEEKMKTYKQDIKKEYENKVEEMLQNRKEEIERTVDEAQFKLRAVEGRHEALLEEMVKLRKENNELKEQEHRFQISVCPHCGKPLLDEQNTAEENGIEDSEKPSDPTQVVE